MAKRKEELKEVTVKKSTAAENACPSHAEILSVVNNTADAHTALKVVDHLRQDKRCEVCAPSLVEGIQKHREFINEQVKRVTNAKRADVIRQTHETHFDRLFNLIK